ncbi:MAG TPA: DUF2877 domain-containing protein [Anaerolineales bacterium]|nr:DUF2877 domain-containing protein [Anaerolineales bacterium]
MYLSAISLGYAVPDGSFDASVHSVFRSALNLRLNGENNLITLIASNDDDLPQGIRIEIPDEFTFEDFGLGELVFCRDGILRFNNNSLTIQLSGARRWKCDLPALEFDRADPATSAAWRFVWEALNERQRISKAEIVAERLLDESKQEGVLHRASKAMRDLRHATQQYQSNIPAVEGLIGLGSGLTPSGDDLLVGYLAGLWCAVRGQSERAQFISRLGETVVSLSSRTNDISRTYLYHAVRGQVSSRLANLAEAISQGTNHERLSEIAEASFKVGHTSGMDAVTGLLIALTAWANQ